MRKIGTLTAELDATKIIRDDDTELVVPAKLCREAVLPYHEGKAYRPGEEIKKSLFTFDGAFVTSGKHPEGLIVTRPQEITGRVHDVDLDEKGDDHGPYVVSGNIHLIKERNTPQFLNDVRKGKKKDVSIGFLYTEDKTEGEHNGEKFDFVQRDIVINHVAAGVPQGRCPSPLCGLTIDEWIKKTTTATGTSETNPKKAGDPWEETEDTIRSGHRSPDGFDDDSFRTINITDGIKAVVACPEGKYKAGKCSVGVQVQSYIFDKEKFTLAEAKAWFKEHEGDAMTEAEIRKRIDGLKKDRDALRKKVMDYYRSEEAQMPQDIKEADEKAYELDREIAAYMEALIQRITEGDETDLLKTLCQPPIGVVQPDGSFIITANADDEEETSTAGSGDPADGSTKKPPGQTGGNEPPAEEPIDLEKEMKRSEKLLKMVSQ